MPELTGTTLKNIREARHISLEQVATATRIRLELLRDLEDEEFDSIASTAQRNGFIRLYSDFLQPSSEELQKYSIQAEIKAPQIQDLGLVKEPGLTEVSIDEVDSGLQNLEPPAGTSLVEPAPKPVPEAKSPEPVKAGLSSILLGKPKSAADNPVLPAEGSRSKALLVEIGQQLIDRRRYLNISWEMITSQVRIPRDQLQALERGDLGYFSNSMQAKGYLQSYAQFLNLDKDVILGQFAEALQLHRLESAKAPRKTAPEAKVLPPFAVALKKFFTLDLFFGTFLILGMMGFLIWGMARMASTRAAEPVQTPLPDLAQVLAETPTPTGEPASGTNSSVPASQETQQTLPTATPLFVPIVSDDPVQLVLIPVSQEWVRIFVDGEEVFTGRLPAGKAVYYTAKDGIMLETGNAAGFRAILNNQEITSFGPIGSIARVNFTAAGMTNLTSQIDQTQATEATNNQPGSTVQPQTTQTLNP